MNSTSKTWSTVLVESAIATGLFMCAAAVAGFLHDAVSPDLPGIYVFWFALAMVPFLLFARRRDAMPFDRWDMVSFVPFLLAIALAASFAFHFRDTHSFWLIAIPATGILCHSLIGFVRSRLPDPSHQTHPSRAEMTDN